MAGFDELQAQMGGLDPLDTPTPGESLTSDPETPNPYEQPPKFTDQQEAVDDLFMRLTDEENIDHFLDLMRDGVPVEDIAQVALFEGFRQGMYTPDLMLMMIEPTIYILLYLADYAGIDNVVLSPESGEVRMGIAGAVDKKKEDMLEEGVLPEMGDDSIQVGDKSIARPDSVSPSLLQKITSGGPMKGKEQE
jgi:hypothetical protein